jgi:hypothetical protein
MRGARTVLQHTLNEFNNLDIGTGRAEVIGVTLHL